MLYWLLLLALLISMIPHFHPQHRHYLTAKCASTKTAKGTPQRLTSTSKSAQGNVAATDNYRPPLRQYIRSSQAFLIIILLIFTRSRKLFFSS
ncbi:hypothetical protein ACFSFZ_16225 [Mixta tenebrionis]|uniref:Uncharacterized protein n=1 Tax=Mixta tenebrionis TaxID=2562439 RepID=A0A506V8Y1_9GAMM|nr:hypothetical protein [Mixta tenebrionis]TPW41730.1 hypothetical protein FKM52_13340 [Mixta tenebrionis]